MSVFEGALAMTFVLHVRWCVAGVSDAFTLMLLVGHNSNNDVEMLWTPWH
jgi:hypothetical protein